MSAVPQELPVKLPNLKAGQAFIVGRIGEVKRTENAVYTIVQTPAPDAFSHPGNHEIVSRGMIGRPGDDCRVVVNLSGYRRSYKNKHGETVYTVDNVLRLADE